MKFDIGDRVRVVSFTKYWDDKPEERKKKEIGTIGIIISFSSDNGYFIRAILTENNDSKHPRAEATWHFCEDDLELYDVGKKLNFFDITI